MYPTLTDSENSFLRHMSMWGSDGYPVQKLGRKWAWMDFCGVRGAPTLYPTKTLAVAAVERYLDVLRDKAAGRIAA
jgi:hypothetical protein